MKHRKFRKPHISSLKPDFSSFMTKVWRKIGLPQIPNECIAYMFDLVIQNCHKLILGKCSCDVRYDFRFLKHFARINWATSKQFKDLCFKIKTVLNKMCTCPFYTTRMPFIPIIPFLSTQYNNLILHNPGFGKTIGVPVPFMPMLRKYTDTFYSSFAKDMSSITTVGPTGPQGEVGCVGPVGKTGEAGCKTNSKKPISSSDFKMLKRSNKLKTKIQVKLGKKHQSKAQSKAKSKNNVRNFSQQSYQRQNYHW